MTRIFRALSALILCGGFAGAQGQKPPAAAAQQQQMPQPQAQPSRSLPRVNIRTPDTKGINLAKYRGKELIIVIFSTECEDCLKTIGFLTKIQQDFGARGLQVVGAAANQNAPYTVDSWAARFKVGFPVGFLDQPSLIKIAAIKPDTVPVVPVVPIVMFVDSALTVRVQYFGDSPLFKDASQEKALRAIADSLLKWQAVHAAPKAPAAPKPETPAKEP